MLFKKVCPRVFIIQDTCLQYYKKFRQKVYLGNYIPKVNLFMAETLIIKMVSKNFSKQSRRRRKKENVGTNKLPIFNVEIQYI